MIGSFALLRNVGQFDSVNAGAHTPLNKFNVIFAENGRGKTTISSILRSLSLGDPNLILERHRLGATHPPHIVINANGTPTPYQFNNGQWTASIPDIVVFDDTFVSQNVCSGLQIENVHQKNLHELILGSQGVALSNAFQTYVAKNEEHNSELRHKESAIPASIRGGLTIDAFCALPENPNIEQELREAERNIAAANSAQVINERPLFSTITLPKIDKSAINAILSLTLAEIEASALKRIKDHFATLGGGGENWVSEGMPKISSPSQNGHSSETCPFCAQDLQTSPLIAHYRAYFGEAYATLKNAIELELQQINRLHGDSAPVTFELEVSKIQDNRHFWTAFITVPAIQFNTDEVKDRWNNARQRIKTILQSKQAAPLELFVLSDEDEEAIDNYNQACDDVVSLCQPLLALNAEIELVKQNSATANLQALRADLIRLKAVEARHSAQTKPLCEDYLDEKTRKTANEGLRERARTALDQYRQTIFPTYEASINAYLARFNAGFRLGSVQSVNNRGGSSCTYSVVINNTSVALEGGVGRPAFRNTLSAGDRNTLALALFFTSIDQDPSISQKIVVIDDPMTSLDEHRTLATVQEIRRLSQRVRQVILLSHSKPFLLKAWEGVNAATSSALQILRNSSGSIFSSWDANADSVTEHDRRYALVLNYINQGNTGNDRTAAIALRPMLESFIRVAYPDNFPPSSLLGNFIRGCRPKIGTQNEVLSLVNADELQAILDYANKFHHDTNASWQTEIINDQE